jgi:hypothetical protein
MNKQLAIWGGLTMACRQQEQSFPPMCTLFERLYAVRLDRLRGLEECRSLLAQFDHRGLLTQAETSFAAPVELMNEDELLAELQGAAGSSNITEFRHVRASGDKRASEEIANRQKCEDFDRFKPLFKKIQEEMRAM